MSRRSEPEGVPDQVGALRRCRRRVHLQVVGDALVDAAILPAGQTDLAVAPRALPRFEHIERSKEANEPEVEGPQEVAVLLAQSQPRS